MTGVCTSVLMTVVIFETKGSTEEPVNVFIPPKIEVFVFFSKLGGQYLGIRYYSESIWNILFP